MGMEHFAGKRVYQDLGDKYRVADLSETYRALPKMQLDHY